MEKPKVQLLKFVDVKGKNKRIHVALYLDLKDKTHFFLQYTKTLVDFKKRKIIETNNVYSVETFSILYDVSKRFLNDSEIENKILNVELSKMQKFEGTSNF